MIEFIQSRNFTKANREDIRLIVVHSMESAEKPGTARAVAKWFASASAPQASAHVCVDNVEIIQCVRAQDVAWGAPNANRSGYHIEHAGRAAQTAADWDDDYSRAMLALSAKHAAGICVTYAIPVRKLTLAEVADGKTKGFCGHVDVTHAFKVPGGHTDPGLGFPWEKYLDLVRTNIRLQGGLAAAEEFPLDSPKELV